jgi:hypothetical protein
VVHWFCLVVPRRRPWLAAVGTSSGSKVERGESADFSAVLRVVLTRRVSAEGKRADDWTDTDAYRTALTGSEQPQPVVAMSEKSLRALERSRCKSSFELERSG